MDSRRDSEDKLRGAEDSFVATPLSQLSFHGDAPKRHRNTDPMKNAPLRARFFVGAARCVTPVSHDSCLVPHSSEATQQRTSIHPERT